MMNLMTYYTKQKIFYMNYHLQALLNQLIITSLQVNIRDALINAITILPMAKAFKAKTIANKIKNIISKDKRKEDIRIAKPKPKSLSRQEVLEIINGLKKALNPKGKPRTRIYLVNGKEELMALWERLTKNFKSERIETSEKEQES